MLTRCPVCATIFRVTAEQLKVRHGDVRCGRCQHVFNALDTLLEELPSEPGSAQSEPALPQSATDDPSPGDAFVITVAAAEAPPASTPESLEADASTAPPTEPAVAPEPLPAADEPIAMAAMAAAAAPPGEAMVEPVFVDTTVVTADFVIESSEDTASPRVRRWPWLAASGLAVLILAFQAAIAFRVDLSARHPDLRPVYVAACQLLACDMPLPREIGLIDIEGSDLIPDPSDRARLRLVATLRNRAPYVQEFPDLELTLTDTQDQPLARRVLTPGQYLAKKAEPAAGFAAQGEVPVSLLVEAGVAASGYRLYVFYP